MGRRPKKTRTPAEMKVTLEALVTSYLADRRLRGLTHNTVTTSERILNRLAHRLGSSTPIGKITDEAVGTFVASLQSAQVRHANHPFHKPQASALSAKTVRKIVRTMRPFGSWLEREGWPNPFAGLQMPKKPKDVVEVLSDEELDRIFGSLSTHTDFGARAHAMMAEAGWGTYVTLSAVALGLSLVVWWGWPVGLLEYRRLLIGGEWNSSGWPYGLPVELGLL